ncbi:MAG: hypothetical protein HYX51_01775 [Chloroflexi bacterium]|nr:hypothetical protein [Chloroflexota bacterium]
MADEVDSYFGLSAADLLRVILSNPRCAMNVRGAVAEEHFRLRLEDLKRRRVIAGYTVGGEGKPDFAVDVNGHIVLVEVKNVEQAKNPANRTSLVRVTIDFKKTRNQLGGKHLRFYHRSEFDVVAACIFNRTGTWDFAYARTASFAEHAAHPGLGHLHDKLVVMQNGQLLPAWTTDLGALLGEM